MMRFPRLESLGCVAAISGIAEGDCARMAAGTDSQRFLEGLGLAGHPLRVLRQTHSATVHIAEKLSAGEPPEGDALITAAPGQVIGVTVADCVPVFLLVPGQAAGIVHAGREGTRQGIAMRTVSELHKAFDVAPEALHAVIGPSAGPCCYEVSSDMAEALAREDIPVDGRLVDLWEANFRQLRAAGVPGAQITISEHCTICGGGFHSYRVTGTAARNLAVVAIS